MTDDLFVTIFGKDLNLTLSTIYFAPYKGPLLISLFHLKIFWGTLPLNPLLLQLKSSFFLNYYGKEYSEDFWDKNDALLLS